MTTKKGELMEEEVMEEEDQDVEGDIPEVDDLAAEEIMHEESIDQVPSEAVRMTADVPVQVVAVLGKKTISVKDLVGLKMGQVIDLARPVNEVVDLIAGGKLVAKGELVDIDGKMGVRIVKMVR